jgi:hypothetical protein
VQVIARTGHPVETEPHGDAPWRPRTSKPGFRVTADAALVPVQLMGCSGCNQMRRRDQVSLCKVRAACCRLSISASKLRATLALSCRSRM